MSKSNRRRVSILVSSQTLYHLQRMAQFCEHGDIGRVVDKLVREKRLDQNEGVRNYGTNEHSPRRQDW